MPLEIRAVFIEGARIRRILHQRADDRRRDVDASAAAGLQQDPQRLCVALKILQICDHLRGQPLPQRPVLIKDLSKILPEPVADHRLAEVPERRIAQIVQQTRAKQHRGDPLRILRRDLLVLRRVLRDHDAELSGDRGDLNGVRQPCPDKIAFIQREDLRFILQSAECSAGDDLPIVFFKRIDRINPEYRRFLRLHCQLFRG